MCKALFAARSMFVTGVSRASRASKDSPLLSFMQPRSPLSFKTLVENPRSTLSVITLLQYCSFALFQVVGGCFHARTFPWAPLTFHQQRALEKRGSLGAQVPHLYVPVSETISRFVPLCFILFWLFYFLACNGFYTISFHLNSLASRTLATATAYTGAIGYTEAHLV